ncbi:hypothetical protein ARTHRO9AX_220236 [Arthrobacter sp. 9AX]|nr:hypothetical protein ARTHRO9AX_220236 [Arthrobacter sp. 9AX]
MDASGSGGNGGQPVNRFMLISNRQHWILVSTYAGNVRQQYWSPNPCPIGHRHSGRNAEGSNRSGQ